MLTNKDGILFTVLILIVSLSSFFGHYVNASRIENLEALVEMLEARVLVLEKQ